MLVCLSLLLVCLLGWLSVFGRLLVCVFVCLFVFAGLFACLFVSLLAVLSFCRVDVLLFCCLFV